MDRPNVQDLLDNLNSQSVPSEPIGHLIPNEPKKDWTEEEIDAAIAEALDLPDPLHTHPSFLDDDLVDDKGAPQVVRQRENASLIHEAVRRAYLRGHIDGAAGKAPAIPTPEPTKQLDS